MHTVVDIMRADPADPGLLNQSTQGILTHLRDMLRSRSEVTPRCEARISRVSASGAQLLLRGLSRLMHLLLREAESTTCLETLGLELQLHGLKFPVM